MATHNDLLSLLSIFPVVLIASSAILLDHSMRYETVLHRCQLQVLMWIVLSLASSIQWPGPMRSGNENDGTSEISNGNGDHLQFVCFVWAQLTVFFNLSSVIVEVTQSRLVAPSRWKKNLRNVLHFLPISSWCSVVVAACSVVPLYTTTTDSKSSMQIDTVWKFSLWTFLGTFLVLWLIRLSSNRRRKISLDMEGMPTTMSTVARTSASYRNNGGILARICGVSPIAGTVDYNSSVYSRQNTAHYWLDERQWYTWNRIQTIQWFAQQLSSKVDNDICEGEKDMVIAMLAPHRVTGDVLDYLADVSQLVALRVPFGPACQLSDSIAELVERYPKPRRKNSVRGRVGRVDNRSSAIPRNDTYDNAQNHPESQTSNGWLDLHDHEYNKEPRSQQTNGRLVGVNNELPLQRPIPSRTFGGQHQYQNDPQIQGGISEEHHEKLNNVMKERFGLELPKLKATDFLAVQKGLSSKANAKHETIPSSNDIMSQPHPRTVMSADGSADPTVRNDFANGTTVPLPYESRQSLPLPSASTDNRSTPTSLSSSGIPQHVLEGMPPGIQDIAKRRPDLIQTIWKQKQQQSPKQPRNPPHLPPQKELPSSTQQYNRLPTLSETSRIDSMKGEDQVYTSAVDYDTDDEDETTSLIHRDNSNQSPTQYKSIHKSIIPSII